MVLQEVTSLEELPKVFGVFVVSVFVLFVFSVDGE